MERGKDIHSISRVEMCWSARTVIFHLTAVVFVQGGEQLQQKFSDILEQRDEKSVWDFSFSNVLVPCTRCHHRTPLPLHTSHEPTSTTIYTNIMEKGRVARSQLSSFVSLVCQGNYSECSKPIPLHRITDFILFYLSSACKLPSWSYSTPQ